MSMFNSLLLQDMYNLVGVECYLFHDYAMALLLLILVGFLLIMWGMVETGNYYVNKYSFSNMLEFVWTVIPAFFLFSLGVPSLCLMYYMEGANSSDLTLKVIGHQWYWSYEINDFGGEVSLDSYMTPTKSLPIGGYRTLEVDNSLVLPMLSNIRVLVTSSDVLHSWALPSMGMKVDACPGRLNLMSLMSMRPGVIFGQCSEICGVNHSFMPIKVEFVDWVTFLKSNL
uniref:Cytochrome c oxidase subunit 2 n=1 Tax=Styela plicata TaxID=7726 RepID=D0Z5P2_STYPL|nr:cytochrome c oxidase subunit II [Styela plicata]CAL24340.1 cytochrome c oxidase subunit II [Styela plicata]